MIKIDHLDHLVLNVASIEASCEFYQRVLGMRPVARAPGRAALHFGSQKINLSVAGRRESELEPDSPTPGSANLCFIASTPITDIVARLAELSIPIAEGPARKTGATGPILSVYIHDPDGNLIEISNPA